MKVLFFTGDHPRHRFMARVIAEAGHLAGLILERRETHRPDPPAGLDEHLTELFRRHFSLRERAENRFFESVNAFGLDAPVLTIAREELNAEPVWRFLDEIRPDVMLSYGVHKLKRATLERCPDIHWNLHGGLSPWYRGCITHFWPSYMLEPQYTGMTVHELTSKLDAGPVAHQVVAPLVRGDGIHDLACRAVRGLADELPELLRRLDAGEIAPPRPQKSAGKLWLARDWHPQHLRLVHDLFDDRIVDAYLDDRLPRSSPSLVRQF